MRVLIPIIIFALLSFATGQGGDAAPLNQPTYRIIFSSDRDTGDQWQLYTMNADGTTIERLLESVNSDYGARISPDGTQMVFTRRTALGYSEVHIMGVGEATSRELVAGSLPSWSPDGTTIAYTNIEEGNAEIYLIDPNGSNRRPLTDHPGRDYAAAWSPTGEQIAFKSDRDGDTALYVTTPEGTDLRRLASADVAAHAPSWSPDGSHILYTREQDDTLAIHIVEVATGETRRLFDTDTAQQMATWTPDGDGVIFVEMVASQPELFRAALDGTERVQLTEHDGWDWYPTIHAP